MDAALVRFCANLSRRTQRADSVDRLFGGRHAACLDGIKPHGKNLERGDLYGNADARTAIGLGTGTRLESGQARLAVGRYDGNQRGGNIK